MKNLDYVQFAVKFFLYGCIVVAAANLLAGCSTDIKNPITIKDRAPDTTP
jgi:hypothetical protein